MIDHIGSDEQNLKELIRESEALVDESIIALARLKQAMPTARQNPIVEVEPDQRAFVRFEQAEGQAISMSTKLHCVPEEPNKIPRQISWPKESESPISAEAMSDVSFGTASKPSAALTKQ